jgi:secretion/DNA translocation related TadE-like protein
MVGERRRRAGGDRGSASVLLVGAMIVLVAAAAVALAVGVVASRRQQANAAADLAALAAAGETSGDLRIACARAAAVADANGGRLDACRAGDDSVEVAASVGLPGALAGFGPVRARARAGPWPPT